MADNECRVCRGGEEPDAPLFYPCLCSGSIKYVHEACLVQWLEVSRKRTCELCQAEFKFAKRYKTGKPQRLSLLQLTWGATKRVAAVLDKYLWLAVVTALWAVGVPVAAYWLHSLAFCRGLADARLLLQSITLSASDVALHCFYGWLVCGAVMLALGVLSFVQSVTEKMVRGFTGGEEDIAPVIQNVPMVADPVGEVALGGDEGAFAADGGDAGLGDNPPQPPLIEDLPMIVEPDPAPNLFAPVSLPQLVQNVLGALILIGGCIALCEFMPYRIGLSAMYVVGSNMLAVDASAGVATSVGILHPPPQRWEVDIVGGPIILNNTHMVAFPEHAMGMSAYPNHVVVKVPSNQSSDWKLDVRSGDIVPYTVPTMPAGIEATDAELSPLFHHWRPVAMPPQLPAVCYNGDQGNASTMLRACGLRPWVLTPGVQHVDFPPLDLETHIVALAIWRLHEFVLHQTAAVASYMRALMADVLDSPQAAERPPAPPPPDKPQDALPRSVFQEDAKPAAVVDPAAPGLRHIQEVLVSISSVMKHSAYNPALARLNLVPAYDVPWPSKVRFCVLMLGYVVILSAVFLVAAAVAAVATGIEAYKATRNMLCRRTSVVGSPSNAAAPVSPVAAAAVVEAPAPTPPRPVFGNVMTWSLDAAIGVAKVSVFMLFRGALRLLLGWFVNASTAVLFGATVATRVAFIRRDPIVALIVHYILGSVFAGAMQPLTRLMRSMLQPTVLQGFLPPPPLADPELEEARYGLVALMRAPLFTTIVNFLGSFVLLSTLVGFCLLLPTTLLSTLFPWLVPLRFLFRPTEHNFSLNVLFFHVALPLTLDRISMAAAVRHTFQWWAVTVAGCLGVEHLLSDAVAGRQAAAMGPAADDGDGGNIVVVEAGEPEVVSPTVTSILRDFTSSIPQALRELLFAALALAFVSIATVAVFGGALSVGRAVAAVCPVPMHRLSDVYTLLIGLYTLLGVGFLLAKTRTFLANHHLLATIVAAVAARTVLIAKWAMLFLAWFGVLPAMCGLSISLIVVPQRMFVETFTSEWLMYQWGLGLPLLQACARCIAMGLFGNMPLQWALQELRIDGFEGLRFWWALRAVIWPIMSLAMTLLCPPHFIARVVVPVLFGGNEWLQLVAIRDGYRMWAIIVVLYYGLRHVSSLCRSLHDSLLEEEYLIGTELLNAEAPAHAEEDAPADDAQEVQEGGDDVEAEPVVPPPPHLPFGVPVAMGPVAFMRGMLLRQQAGAVH